MVHEKRKRVPSTGTGDVAPMDDIRIDAKIDGARANPAESGTKRDRHFRDLYAKPPDFTKLALLDRDFAAVIKGRELNFNDPAAVTQLTKTLLRLDFDLQIELPDDRLCPPVANRHNYILWIKELLDSTSYDQPGGKLVGLDIGTGASCVYPLLGCSQRPWSFIATDIDPKSIEYAEKNVRLNQLEHRIRVVLRRPDGPLIGLDDVHLDSIDFCMTNPPFYESDEAMLQSAAQKSRPPFTACSGAKVEMVTEGGEVAFVTRILEEALLLRERVRWYTAMVGFLSSLTHLVEKLHERGIDNYAVTELVQGNKTRRWAIAWSFGPMRPAQHVARGLKAAPSRTVLPLITEFEVGRLPSSTNIGSFADKLSSAVGTLELISWHWDKEKLNGTGRAADKVWTRAWRRKKKREMDLGEDDGGNSEEVDTDEKPCVLGFKVTIRVTREDAVVGCRWLEGHDGPGFESFGGFLKSTVNAIQNQVG